MHSYHYRFVILNKFNIGILLRKIAAWCMSIYAKGIEKISEGIESLGYMLTSHAYRIAKKAKEKADA